MTDGAFCVPLQVGFCTVYAFYAYPESTRMRVSQILVLPPYQRQGVGRLLLQAVYRLADQQQALDVTVGSHLMHNLCHSRADMHRHNLP